MNQNLFVYGTLAPGRSNEHILWGLTGEWKPARVRGIVLENGWGEALGYPAIILSPDAPEVHGLIFSSDDLPVHWARIDEFEGEGYRRVLTTAVLEDGLSQTVFVYELQFEAGAGPFDE